MRPAVFLDRDGVLLYDIGYLARREDLRWYSFAMDAVRLLNRAGFLVFVVTNQGGVGLGYYTEEFVRDTHDAMTRQLVAAGAHIDGWWFCPHHPRAVVDHLRVVCECRKPASGMVRAAQARFPIDLARSFVVGDKATDMGLAESLGVRGLFVRTGQGESELARAGGTMPSGQVVPDLMAAAAWIMAADRPPESGLGAAGRPHER
jgi:D-glycero-D-manno-heptose 1,7-bisphosphate phosphatase